jgi:hypothetical protein
MWCIYAIPEKVVGNNIAEERTVLWRGVFSFLLIFK